MITLLSLALYGALFYLMMRFGCGGHMSGHAKHGNHETRDQVK